MDFKVIGLITDTTCALPRLTVEPLELLDGVTDKRQLFFPANSLLKDMSVEQITTIVQGYLKARDPVEFLSSNGIAQKPNGFGRHLPYLVFTLPTGCSSCSEHVFVRRMTGRSSYRHSILNISSGSYESDRYVCVNKFCNAVYQVNDSEHSYHCACRLCGIKSGHFPALRALPVPAAWHSFIGLSFDQKRSLKANVSLANDDDAVASNELISIVFSCLTRLFSSISLNTDYNNKYSKPFVKFKNNATDIFASTTNASDFEHIAGTVTTSRMLPAEMNIEAAFSFVRGLLTELLPDDALLVQYVTEYCFEIVRADVRWKTISASFRPSGVKQIFMRLKDTTTWDRDLAKKLIHHQSVQAPVVPKEIIPKEVGVFCEAMKDLIDAYADKNKAIDKINQILAQQLAELNATK